MNKAIPVEVRDYLARGRRKIVSVSARDDFTLALTFDNGERRIYDMNNTIRGAVFAPIRSLDAFKRVYLDDCGAPSWDIDQSVDSSVVWSNKLDISPDSCYIYGVPDNE